MFSQIGFSKGTDRSHFRIGWERTIVGLFLDGSGMSGGRTLLASRLSLGSSAISGAPGSSVTYV